MPRRKKDAYTTAGDEANGRGRNGDGTANLGFEQKLWLAADKLRGTMDASEYKHTVLGLIFLKYISDSFESRRTWLVREAAENVFWVPPSARWAALQRDAHQPTIGVLIDKAMDAIERENPSLKGILPKTYARPDLDKTRLGELIDLIGTITVGDDRSRSQDVLGRVYDPCCGSGGMFVQSEKFAEAHGGRRNDISVYGQESNPTTWRLARMNLAKAGKGMRERRGEQGAGKYADVAGFCCSAARETIERHGFVLTPGRYVGAADVEDDGEPFPEKMSRLAKTLGEPFAESARLEKRIRANLKGLGFELP